MLRMIIRLSGLPGSGKTTLGESLAKELGYKLFRIDRYRSKWKNEFSALIDLFNDMIDAGDDFILDSVGFNNRIQWVFQFIKVRVVDIKLICEKEILFKRIDLKVLPVNEYFPYTTGDRKSYVDNFFDDMFHKPADFIIDTSHITKKVMLRCAIDNLNFFRSD